MFRRVILTSLLGLPATLLAGSTTAGANVIMPNVIMPAPDTSASSQLRCTLRCSELKLHGASTSKLLSEYRFTARCTCDDVRAPDKPPAVHLIPVLIEGTWSPESRRASERVVVDHPDFGVTFTTGAACKADPFVAVKPDCSDRTVSANKFDAFLKKDVVPFAGGGATQAEATESKARVGPNGDKLFAIPQIARIRPTGNVTHGVTTQLVIEVTGGAGLCPMDVYLGDGAVRTLPIWNQTPFTHTIAHTFTRAGTFKVRARATSGCVGEALASVQVD